MRVVVGECSDSIELVNCDASGFAQKELLDDAILYRNDRCSARRKNIRRFMQFSSNATLREGALDVASMEALDRQSQRSPG